MEDIRSMFSLSSGTSCSSFEQVTRGGANDNSPKIRHLFSPFDTILLDGMVFRRSLDLFQSYQRNASEYKQVKE